MLTHRAKVFLIAWRVLYYFAWFYLHVLSVQVFTIWYHQKCPQWNEKCSLVDVCVKKKQKITLQCFAVVVTKKHFSHSQSLEK